MANVIQDKLFQLWSRVLAGPVGKFFHWWFHELRAVLPLSWQQRLQHAMRRTIFILSDTTLMVAVDENRQLQSLESFELAQDASLQHQQVIDLLAQTDLVEAPRYLLLERKLVLKKEVLLPAAAESSLAQVLAFEMDRQTPFKASDVYFGWILKHRNDDTGQIRLDLYVAPRKEVDQAVRQLGELKLAPAGVDVLEDGKTLGLNLLPPEQRVRAVNRKTRLNYVMAATAAIFLALVMTQSLYLREHQLDELVVAIEAVQGEAHLVRQIKEQIMDSSEAASFLTVRHDALPMVIELLAAITALLPDDTYLDRLVIKQNTVQIQGKSQNAQQLIELVNESELLDDASFRGSTRLDARSGLEIFEINAVVAGVEKS